MIGINLSGAEFGRGNVYGRDYVYPTRSDLDYYASRHIALVRLPVKWERLQPTAGGTLDPREVARLKAFLVQAAEAGTSVIVDLHNYGRYHGQVLGTPGAATADFAAFWKALATEISGMPALAGYDLMNEPHDMGSATAWPRAAQAAIDAIRSIDSRTAIYVEGDSWASADVWTRSNKALVLSDPADNLVYEAHVYFDRYGSGAYAESYDAQGADPLIGVERLQSFARWLDAHGARGIIGEVAVPKSDPRWLTVLDNFLGAAESYGIDVAYWGGGSAWGNYPLAPRARTGEANPQLAVLERYADAPAAVDLSGGGALIGGRGDDSLIGADGDQRLAGRAGADRIDGGGGIDLVSYRSSPRAVDVDLLRSLQHGGDAEGDRLSGIEGIEGSGFGDVLRGDAGANQLRGFAGADTLEGRGGGDLLDGGAGIDTAVYAMPVTIDLALAVQGNGDRLISIENVTGSDFADRLFGDDRANILSGGGGDDWLEGRGGGDTLDGGTGVDTVSYASAGGGVTVQLESGRASSADSGSDRLIAIENITGSGFDDVLRGSAGTNVIDGGDGADRIIGLGGADRLTGGAGADAFVFTSIGDSLPGAPDVITDFTSGSDRIDLSGIDAMLGRSGNQHFAFIGGAAFTGPGQLRIEAAAGGGFTIFGNVDADLAPDFAVSAFAGAPLTAADFVL